MNEALMKTFKTIKKNSYIIFAFLLPFVLLGAALAFNGVWPFGAKSILKLDFQAQYIYYFEELREMLTSGESILYSWNRSLGGEWLGMIAYYLGSPLNLLVAVFPKDKIVIAVTFIIMLKFGAMGATFAYFLKKSRPSNNFIIIAFSTMYALCGYAVVRLMDPMWLDALILLPLVILGLEQLITKKKFILYTASLALVGITNYYIAMMVGIFTVLYFGYYFFSHKDEIYESYGMTAPSSGDPTDEDYPLMELEACPEAAIEEERPKAKKALIEYYPGMKVFIRFGLFTLLAVAIAAIILLPAYSSLQFGKSTFTTANRNFSPYLKFDLMDFFVKMLPGSYDTVDYPGTPMVYSGILALLLLPIYFVSKHVKMSEKLLGGGLLSIIFLSFLINTADLFWHGLQTPNWHNHRYAFVFTFTVILFAYEAIRGIDKISFKNVFAWGMGIGLIVMIAQKENYEYLDDTNSLLLSVLLVGIYLAVLYAIHKRKNIKLVCAFLVVAVSAETLVGTVMNIAGADKDVGNVQYYEFASKIDRIQDAVDYVQDMDDGFYRMESTIYRKTGGVNEPMAYNFKGISHSTSTLNAKVISLLEDLGYSSRSHWSKYLGGTPASDALIGIKYVVTKNELDSNIFDRVYVGDDPGYKSYNKTTGEVETKSNSGSIYVYKNKYALSLAFGVSPQIKTLDRESLYTPFTLLNSTFATMQNNQKASPIYVPIECKMDFEGASYQKYGTPFYDAFEYPKANAKVEYTLVAPRDGEIFFYFPSEYDRKCNVYVSSTTSVSERHICEYFGNETQRVFSLGKFSQGEEITVKLTLNDQNLFIIHQDTYFYYFDQQAFNSAMLNVSDSQLNITEYSNTKIKGDISVQSGDEFIFTTIPYDSGWRVKVDGKYVETQDVYTGLLGFETTAGYHTVEMVYRPNSYILGLVISIIAMAIFAALIFLAKGQRLFERNAAKKLAVANNAPVDMAQNVENDVVNDTESEDITPQDDTSDEEDD